MKYTKRNIQRMKFLREVVMKSSMLTSGRCFHLEELRPISHKSIVVKKLNKGYASPVTKKIERKTLYK